MPEAVGALEVHQAAAGGVADVEPAG